MEKVAVKLQKKYLEKVKTYYGVYAFKKNHPVIKALREEMPEPVIHGHKVWDSSLLIMDYLENNPVEKQSRIMELGCGWGVLSAYCAKTFDAKVIGVDADEHVFPFLDVHADLNGVEIKNKVCKFEKLKKSQLGKQDLIVGGDVCFWDELTEALYTTIKKSVKAGAGKIIIADPGRSPFFNLAKRCKKEFGAKKIEWDIYYPKRATGYLLIIEP